ncbi:hypothetical protein MalM25_02170 [Planctomycetes bacterium MalM25]|nr:hypothetical protein MalM25_02170 [Planctomycetes bacterium MalM25]
MTTSPSPKSSPPPVGGWRLVAALAVALLLVAMLRGWGTPDASDPANQADPKRDAAPVTLEKRLPDQPAQSAQVAWAPGTTVLEATRRAGEDDPAWVGEWRGEGAMSLLILLGGEANQGAEGLNWQFEVNGVYADRGAGAFELAPGDRVLWKLAPYE